MSKNVAMFVDVANMYYAARGQDVDVDYVALLKHATKGRDLIRAYAYTGLDPENENQRKFIDFLAKNGYKPVVKDIRKFGDGRMKANLDIELVVDLFRLADRMDIAVIVSGDGDFAPAIRALQDKGVRAEVISFKPNTSSDLIAVADEFMDIMKIASISRKEARAGREAAIPTPEMPAKEVAPEFGFREASPTVAAAALAAIKGGGATDGPRRGRATSTRRVRTAAAPSEPAAGEPIAVAATEGDAESRRRRRRRGGRGRGRGRRDEDVTPAIATGDEEIGWEEFDDLSQLDGGLPDDRAFTFEEADPATLAELGISPDEIPAAGASPAGEPTAGEAEAKPSRRSTRAGKAAAGASADEPKARRSPRAAKPKAEADAGESPKARPRSTRAAKPRADDEGAGEAAPKPRRRSTRATGDEVATGEGADAGASDAEPQGIWGRFRQARKPRGTAG